MQTVQNFKTIAVVPTAKDFIDIVLSKTQRKTPTVVRSGFQMSRIREFYARKIKFTQQTYHDKLTHILTEFPKLDDIHPFFSDLVNILYSRDHYKLALGQINTARTIIDNIAKDYLHLIKFGDSLYRCKQSKRAALGRMCTCMRKLGPSLAYLEQVRQHLSRLPAINPADRTLIITGYPNVGKSSFINKVTRANVDVQPYPFTTKSVFVGHMDDNFLRYQVIDTPGILDHPLEQRNTIEMQAITALAHLQAIVLFFIDISETCGYSIKQQVALYHNIKPLFSNKPMLVIANKTDLKKWEALDPEDRELIESVAKDRHTQVMPMSNHTEEGIYKVKSTACEMLLSFRVNKKMQGQKVNDIVNRIHVAYPTARDTKTRSNSIPASVLAAKEAKALATDQDMTDAQDDLTNGDGSAAPAGARPKRQTLRDVEAEHGGPGVFSFDYRNHFQLANDDWKFDIVPEILDGKNIADFVHADIEQRLLELEQEEDEFVEADANAPQDMDADSDLDAEQLEQVAAIRKKKGIIQAEASVRKNNNRPVVPRRVKRVTAADMESHLSELGLNAEKVRSRSRKRKHVAASEDVESSAGADAMDVDRSDSKSRTRSRSHSRAASQSAPSSRSRTHTPGDGFRDVKQKQTAERMAKKHRMLDIREARASESDRRVFDAKPKHLFSGQRGIGKTDRR